MINLVSDWDLEKINDTNEAFKERGKSWVRFKKDYFSYFVELKKIWESTENPKYKFKVYSLFKQEYE